MLSGPEPKRLWSKLRRLLIGAGGGEKYRPADSLEDLHANRTDDGSPQSAPSVISRAAFDRGLAELLARQQVLIGGKIQIVDIGKIRDHLGDRWASIRSRIHRIIENILDQRLTRHDLFARYEDLHYVIVFGDSTADEAALKCTLLTKEILAKVLGSETVDDKTLEFRTAVATLNGVTAAGGADGPAALARHIEDQAESVDFVLSDQPFSELGQITALSDLSALLDKAEKELGLLTRLVGQNEPGSGSAGLQKRLMGLAEALRRTEDEALQESVRECVVSEPGKEDDIAARARLYDDAMRRLRMLLSRVEASLSRPTIAAERCPDDVPADAWFRYWPIWSFQQKALGIYFCQMMVKHGSDSMPAETALLREPDLTLLGQLDRTVLRRAVVDLEAAAQMQMASAVCVPVHFSALASAATRREFMSFCNSISPKIRSMLVWEIVDVPAGLWENSIFSIVSMLKPFSRAIFIRRAIDESDFGVLGAVGLHSVGLDLRCLANTETQILPLLNRFADRAHRSGLRCHVHGLTTSSLCLLAISAGFDYVSGPEVCESTETPWGILPFDAERLFLRKFASSIQSELV